MIKIIVISLALTTILGDIVPCTETEMSTLATISDCSASREDQYTLEWGVKITFKK